VSKTDFVEKQLKKYYSKLRVKHYERSTCATVKLSIPTVSHGKVESKTLPMFYARYSKTLN